MTSDPGRKSITAVAGSWALRAIVPSVVGAFTAAGALFAWNAAHITRAEAADMISTRVPTLQERDDHALLFTLSNDMKVLLGRDRVRYAARVNERRKEMRDDAELQAVQVYDSEVLHGSPVEQAIVTAVGSRLP